MIEDKIAIEERFVFTSKARNKVILFIIIGLLLSAVGCFMLMNQSHGSEHGAHGGHGEAFSWTQRLIIDLWHNSVFFTGISVMAVFFVAYNYVAYAGWSAGLIRVPMAFGQFLPIAAFLVIGLFFIGKHDIFHWTHDGIMDPASHHYDKIIAGKQGFLNVPFFAIRLVLYFALWYFMFFIIRKNSLQEDINGTTAYWHKNTVAGAVFLVIFGVTSSTAAWDLVMSVDTHWFSTMFGWYVFASWHVSALAAITLTVVLLKERGYLSIVNENHLHDLGKFMFAFSIFWTYVWFSQFLLIFYANLPEETVYFIDRLRGFGNHYTGLFFFNIVINFTFPFLVLMTRESKRAMIFLKIVAIGILFGHWLDFYLMLMPATLKGNSGFGFLEIGLATTFVSVFIYVVATTLSKSLLIAKNHPMLEESMNHHI